MLSGILCVDCPPVDKSMRAGIPICPSKSENRDNHIVGIHKCLLNICSIRTYTVILDTVNSTCIVRSRMLNLRLYPTFKLTSYPASFAGKRYKTLKLEAKDSLLLIAIAVTRVLASL